MNRAAEFEPPDEKITPFTCIGCDRESNLNADCQEFNKGTICEVCAVVLGCINKNLDKATGTEYGYFFTYYSIHRPNLLPLTDFGPPNEAGKADA